MASRILFLDYDGVVNTPMWDEEGKKCRYNFPEHNKVNNFQAVQWVSEFCQKWEFAIVVTSTWRTDDNWRECLINGGLREGIEILDRTEDLAAKHKIGTRGHEIKKWLEEHPEVEHFYILDDLDDFLPEQKEFFIQTNPNVGFNMGDYIQLRGKFVEDRAKKVNNIG